ncbi:MAG: DoxX family membrane protein [Verrucomicrobiota bacterium]
MKTAALIARLLLGLIFVVFGLNAFFHFIPIPPPQGQAGAFMGALFGSGYLYVVKVIEVAGGLLLLGGRFVPLGLTLVGPVVVNIMLYDLFLDRSGLPLGIVLSVLSLVILFHHRKAFEGLLKA